MLDWLGSIFSAIANVVKSVWHWLFNNLFSFLSQWFRNIWQWVSKYVRLVIQIIKAQIAAINQLYNNVVRPFMNLLQRIRGFLMIFRIFGFKFAQELDQYIADLEARINGAFLAAEGDIGRLLQWLEWIVDPNGLFQPLSYLLSAIQTLPQLWAILQNLPSVALGADQQKQQQQLAQSLTWTNVQSTIRARASGPTAQDQEDIAAIVKDFQGDGYSWVV